jgi:hypothetical protein
VVVVMMPVAEVTAAKVATTEREPESQTVVSVWDKIPLGLPAACPNPIVDTVAPAPAFARSVGRPGIRGRNVDAEMSSAGRSGDTHCT